MLKNPKTLIANIEYEVLTPLGLAPNNKRIIFLRIRVKLNPTTSTESKVAKRLIKYRLKRKPTKK